MRPNMAPYMNPSSMGGGGGGYKGPPCHPKGIHTVRGGVAGTLYRCEVCAGIIVFVPDRQRGGLRKKKQK